MRLICTLQDQKQGYIFSTFLQRKGIENQLEIIPNTDWSSPDYGTAACRIWVIDEDQVDAALQWADRFTQDPGNPQFLRDEETPLQIGKKQIRNGNGKIISTPESRPLGPVTLYTLVTCVLLLILSTLTAPYFRPIPAFIPPTPVFSSPINKTLMFDYPEAYEVIDRLVSTYGIDALQHIDTLPQSGQDLIKKFKETPYWQGLYDKVVHHYKNPNAPWEFNAPVFEKIRQGEIWRLFTPALLHGGFFHLFFNMIWLIVLGRQIEQRLGTWRYIFFILLAAIVSNIAQYLMSGPDFLGFSGVLCAMFAFIWVRQRRTAWEGYQLDRGTLLFIAAFILLLFGLQLIAFFLETFSNTALATGIANTAHITGALVGWLMARMHFFSWHRIK